MRKYRAKNRERANELSKQTWNRHRDKYNKKRCEVRKKFKEKWYLNLKCKKCSSSEKIDFHHKNPNLKLFPITKGYNKSDEEIKKEIEKCIPLCHSCHSTHTFKEYHRKKRSIILTGNKYEQTNI